MLPAVRNPCRRSKAPLLRTVRARGHAGKRATRSRKPMWSTNFLKHHTWVHLRLLKVPQALHLRCAHTSIDEIKVCWSQKISALASIYVARLDHLLRNSAGLSSIPTFITLILAILFWFCFDSSANFFVTTFEAAVNCSVWRHFTLAPTSAVSPYIWIRPLSNRRRSVKISLCDLQFQIRSPIVHEADGYAILSLCSSYLLSTLRHR